MKILSYLSITTNILLNHSRSLESLNHQAKIKSLDDGEGLVTSSSISDRDIAFPTAQHFENIYWCIALAGGGGNQKSELKA